MATIKELVALGMGITVIAHSACREEELAGRLAVIPIENARMMREINMVHHKASPTPKSWRNSGGFTPLFSRGSPWRRRRRTRRWFENGAAFPSILCGRL